MSTLKRTVYGDKDDIYERLITEQGTAHRNSLSTASPRYLREFYRGRAEGLEYAAHLIRDWASETEPEEVPEPEPWDLASRASWFHVPRDVDDLIRYAARDHDAWTIYAAWYNQADQPALMKSEQVRREIAEYIATVQPS
jgi:hypothetical protein